MQLSPTAKSLFTALPGPVRGGAAETYLKYLKAREGRLDLATRTLSQREPFFVRMAEQPVRATMDLDHARFHRNHASDQPEADLSREMLWLLAVAKANRTECYGMEAHIVVNGILDGEKADTQAYVDMQEVYHTRILLDVLRCFGLEIEIGRPALAARISVQAMVRLPQRVALPLILCSEFIATVVFRLLLDRGRELFGHMPEVWSRASTLLQQIMIDEVGHISYCHARLGPLGLSAARALLPAVAASLLSDQKEFALLVGRARFAEACATFNLDAITEGCGEKPFWLGEVSVA
ncbi:MAG: hypothetical protein JWM10_1663 [Myxococcaceae bacterium]|nr:hypothetical protein [Myxococcaceae bacterium]